MNSEIIKIWLERKKRSDSLIYIGVSSFAMLCGLLVFFLTFWFTYAMLYFIGFGFTSLTDLMFDRNIYINHQWRLVGSGVFVALLFIQNLRTNPWHWLDYHHPHYGPAFFCRRMGFGFLVAHPFASANVITDALLTGPRLICGSYGMFVQMLKLHRLDTAGCADLLAYLAGQPTLVLYDELDSSRWKPWLSDLRLVEGIVFLEKGLKMSDELRRELVLLR